MLTNHHKNITICVLSLLYMFFVVSSNYIFLLFFACVLCPLSNLHFPDNIQLSTARTTSNSEISGPFMDINITLFNVSLDMLIFSLFFCLFIQENPLSHSHVLQLIVIMILKSINTQSIIFIFIQNVHVNIINFFYFQLGYT